MKIELEEREVDTLPNDAELGAYVRFKMHQAKFNKVLGEESSDLENVTITSNKQLSWTSSTTNQGPVEIDRDPNSNKI
jgi:hypothetical protein